MELDNKFFNVFIKLYYSFESSEIDKKYKNIEIYKK